MKAVREAVLRSNGAKHQSPSRRSQIAQFAAGLAVGCLALAAIGAGLVETGRVHFSSSSPAPSASTNRGGDSPEIGTSELGNRQATIELPAALPDPANGSAALAQQQQQQQPEATATSPARDTRSDHRGRYCCRAAFRGADRQALCKPSRESFKCSAASAEPAAGGNAGNSATGECPGAIAVCTHRGDVARARNGRSRTRDAIGCSRQPNFRVRGIPCAGAGGR